MKNLTYISPLFIVTDLKASLSFYADKPGFEIRFVGRIITLIDQYLQLKNNSISINLAFLHVYCSRADDCRHSVIILPQE